MGSATSARGRCRSSFDQVLENSLQIVVGRRDLVDGAGLAKFTFRYDKLAAGETAPAEAGKDPAAPAAAAEPAAPDVPAEVEQLNAKLADWVYEIPDYRFELLTRRVADLVQDRGAAKPAETPPPPQ